MPKTESAITAELLRDLRKALPEAIIFKFADRWTGGIPDFAITVGERTTWWEAKRHGEKLTPIQKATMSRLKLSFVIYYMPGGGYAIVQNPGPTNFFENRDILMAMIRIAKGEHVWNVK